MGAVRPSYENFLMLFLRRTLSSKAAVIASVGCCKAHCTVCATLDAQTSAIFVRVYSALPY